MVLLVQTSPRYQRQTLIHKFGSSQFLISAKPFQLGIHDQLKSIVHSQQTQNVASTSLQRRDVAARMKQRCNHIVGFLGFLNKTITKPKLEKTYPLTRVSNEDLNQPANLFRLTSHRCSSEETVHPWLAKMLIVNILIRLYECTGWSKSSLDAH